MWRSSVSAWPPMRRTLATSFFRCACVWDMATSWRSYTMGEYTTRDRTMPAPDISAFTHSHQFNHVDAKAERNTRRVVFITAAMMVVEITGGYWLNSMALLADGWHMSSHALAMGLSVMAYALARRYAKDRRFAFGTWKIEILGGFSSALLLAVVAALIDRKSVV